MQFMNLSDISPLLRWSSLPEHSHYGFDENQALERLAEDLFTDELWACVLQVQEKRQRMDVDTEDLFMEAYKLLAVRIAMKRGLAVPPRWEKTTDFGPWFRTVCRNAARDILDQPGWREIEGLWDLPREPTDGQYGGSWGIQEPRAELTAYYEFLRDLANAEGIRNPNWLLAHVALSIPELLTKGLVMEAKRWRNGQTLHRSAESTWHLLQWWCQEHALDPRGRRARRDLAWILRSDDEAGPETWARNEPVHQAARNVIQQWDGHARRNGVLERCWPGYSKAA